MNKAMSPILPVNDNDRLSQLFAESNQCLADIDASINDINQYLNELVGLPADQGSPARARYTSPMAGEPTPFPPKPQGNLDAGGDVPLASLFHEIMEAE